MAWIYLAAAAVFEVTFALSMKYADGFTRIGPTVVTVIFGFALLGEALTVAKVLCAMAIVGGVAGLKMSA